MIMIRRNNLRQASTRRKMKNKIENNHLFRLPVETKIEKVEEKNWRKRFEFRVS